MKQLIIFDLDGTLLNTIDDLAIAANHALQQMGFPTHPIEDYPFFVGNGVKRLLERVLPPEHQDEETVSRLRNHFALFYDSHLTVNTRPYDGINDLLDNLSRQNIKLAVASNKYHSAVTKIIRHYFPHIPWVAIEGQKDIYPPKPHPAIVHDILGKCPTPLAQTLYIGDSGVDMETAQNSGIESVGVTWGFRPEDELVQFNARHIVNHPRQILDIINQP